MKKILFYLSVLLVIVACAIELIFTIPLQTREKLKQLMLQQGINVFGHQLGWQLGRVVLRKVYQATTTEWPLYAVLYLVLPFWALIVSKYPGLQSLGLGRSVAGFASIGVWILMERLLELRAKPRQWPRYFSFYIIFYHLSGLLTQLSFGTSLLAYRNAWASMLACLILTTVLPRFLLWSEGAEVDRGSFFQRFFYHLPKFQFSWLRRVSNFSKKKFASLSGSRLGPKPSRKEQWALLGKKVVNWKHFNRVAIGLAGLMLSYLSAAYPIFFHFRIQESADPFPMSFWSAIVCLLIGNICAFFTRRFS